MGNYHPISMKMGTQTKINMLSLKIHNAGSVGQVSRWAAAAMFEIQVML
jgi:hypothetical protein